MVWCFFSVTSWYCSNCLCNLPPSRLEALGGHCLHNRVDIDQEDWPNIDGWMEGVVERVGDLELSTTMDYLDLSSLGEEDSGYSRTRPFFSSMTVSWESLARSGGKPGQAACCWNEIGL